VNGERKRFLPDIELSSLEESLDDATGSLPKEQRKEIKVGEDAIMKYRCEYDNIGSVRARREEEESKTSKKETESDVSSMQFSLDPRLPARCKKHRV
jgi:hypothetical protein